MTSGLPRGWTEVAFGEITLNFDGKRVPVKASDRAERQGAYRYYGAQGVIDYIDEYIFDGTYLLIAEDGANLASRVQPIAQVADGQFWVNNHAHVVQAAEGVSLKYLLHFMNWNPLNGVIRGTAQPKLTQKDLNGLRVPLPPYLEQERIVAAIEEQVSRIEIGVKALSAALVRSLRMRAAILESVINGRLARDPSHWTTVGSLAESLVDGPFGSNLKTEHYQSNGVRVIRLQNIGDGFFDDADKAYISEEHAKTLSRHEARSGDVLIAAMGEVLPRVCLMPQNIDFAIVKADCFRLRLRSHVLPQYVAYMLSAPRTRRCASTQIAGVGRPRLNLSKVSSLKIPIPLVVEQEKIIASVDEQFSRLSATEESISRTLRSSDGLRSTILAAAFSGRLT